MTKKILFLIPSLVGGGAEKVLVNMVNQLNPQKYDVTVYCLFDQGVNKKDLLPHIHYNFVFKQIIRGNTYFLKLFSPSFLYKYIVKEDYDIVVSYFQSPTTRIVAGCSNPNTKLVQWVHNEFHDRKKIQVCYRNEKECLELQQKYDETVFVSKSVRDIYLSTFPELQDSGNNRVLYNVVESEKIREKAEESIGLSAGNKTKKNLVAVGRLVPQKSFDRLLNVVKKLKSQNLDFHLNILGTGHLEATLKEQVKQLGIEEEVSFLGYQENPYKYMKNADLFICSSLHEGFCTAVTESLIVGTPVITTDCSGMKELLGENEHGLIVNNDEESLYEGLLELLSHDELLETYTRKAIERGWDFVTVERVKEIEEFFDAI